MSENKEDRRIRRTKKMLKQGLAELMLEQEFKNITVKDITDRVDLNRGTFYLHYKDTYDLLEKIENEILEEIQVLIDTYIEPGDKKSIHSVLNPVIDYIAENEKLCRAIFENRVCGDFIGKFRDLMYLNGERFIRYGSRDVNPQKYDLAFEFVAYGVIGTIKRWFDSGMRISKEEIVKILYQAIISTFDGVLSED